MAKLDPKILTQFSAAQLLEAIQTKRNEELAPTIAKYYETEKEMKTKLKAMKDEILKLDPEWKPQTFNQSIIIIVEKNGKPMTKQDIENEVDDPERNVGLALAQLVKSGGLLLKDDKYSVPQAGDYSLQKKN